MSVLAWLKQFGVDVLKVFQVVEGVAPLIGVAAPKAAGVANVVASDLQQLLATIQQVEVIGAQANLTGPQKLLAATPIVRQQVITLLASWGFSVADQNRFAAATQGLTSVLADILNTVEAVKTS